MYKETAYKNTTEKALLRNFLQISTYFCNSGAEARKARHRSTMGKIFWELSMREMLVMTSRTSVHPPVQIRELTKRRRRRQRRRYKTIGLVSKNNGCAHAFYI